jgi:hypothetical protein
LNNKEIELRRDCARDVKTSIENLFEKTKGIYGMESDTIVADDSDSGDEEGEAGPSTKTLKKT